MSCRLLTSTEKAQSCSCGQATLAGMSKVASHVWFKTGYFIKLDPCPLIPDSANIVCPCESTDVFQDQSLHSVPIQPNAPIHQQCRYFEPCSYLLILIVAIIGCHHCGLEINLHPRHQHCDTVVCKERHPTWMLRSCLRYRVFLGTKVIVMCKSCNVKPVENVCRVANMKGNDRGGVGGQKGYVYSSSGDVFIQLVLLVNEHQTSQSSLGTTTTHDTHVKFQPEIQSSG